jgi:lysophospholipid acyltransferase (LPLAT)-like uncharacterized protein
MKKNRYFLYLFSFIIFLYLKFVYLTSKISISREGGVDDALFSRGGIIFVVWHDQLALILDVFLKCRNVYALTSKHNDGLVINTVVRLWGYNVLLGSTNKGGVKAIKDIITTLSSGSNVVITPDGPRGPRHVVTSTATKIAHKKNFIIIPISCKITEHFKLNSWDQMIIPKPFSNIKINLGNSVNITGDDNIDKSELARMMMSDS